MSSIVYPTRKQVIDRILTDIQNELPDLNPFLRASIIRAIGVALGGRLYDVYKQQQQAQDELFIDTASVVDFIRRLGLFKGLDINPALSAKGLITATGTQGSIIDDGTIWQTTSGEEYEVINGSYIIQDQFFNVSSLTRSGSIATAITSTPHNFAVNIDVTTVGADQTEYNGTFTITAVTADTFSYIITGTPATPATGTITALGTYASIEVKAVETGIDTNLDESTKVALKNPVVGFDDDAYAQYSGVTGGANEETIDEYRLRVQEAYAFPISNSNDSDIIRVAKSITGVTRVWVFDATPIPGEFETYFTRDDDTNVIPSPSEVNDVKIEILKIKPAPMLDDDVHVYAPTPIQVDFVFTSLSPDSSAMRTEIDTNLQQFFKEGPNVSENVSEDTYRSIIAQTINPVTGDKVNSFTLSQPAGDIPIANGELAIYGSVNWSI